MIIQWIQRKTYEENKKNQINILNFKTILRMQWINVLKTKTQMFYSSLGTAKG